LQDNARQPAAQDPAARPCGLGHTLLALHIAPTPFFSDRGCHMRIRGLIRALREQGVSSVLCTYHLGRDVDGIDTVRTAVIPGYTKLEAGPSAFKYLADILLFFKVCGVIRKRKPDVIHAHLHEGALIGWAASLMFFWRRIPLIFDVQGSLVGELDDHGYFDGRAFVRKIFMALERVITRMPDRIICSSQHSVDLMIDMFGLDETRVLLVNDGADRFEVDDAGNLAEDLGLPGGRPVVIYTGGLQRTKGLEQLVRVMRDARDRNLDCHFLIIGYPDEALRASCQQYHLTDQCTLAGRVEYDALGRYLALADAALEPKLSRSGEASGKLLNYMEAGLPVVCFDTPGNQQILGDLGYYVRPGSTGLVDGLEAVLADPDGARRRGLQGRARVRERFSWNAAARKVLTVYCGSLTGD